VLDVVEAIYRDEESDEAWLRRVLEVARPSLDAGLGLMAMPFVAAPSGVLVPWVVDCHTKRGVGARLVMEVMATVRRDASVSRVYRTQLCQTASEAGFVKHPSWGILVRKGVLDFLGLNAADTDGHGCLVGAFLPRVQRLDPRRRDSLSRVTAHLVAGHRFRRRARVSASATEAVLDSSAKMLHAEGEARTAAAQEALGRAARALERARCAAGRAEPDASLRSWKGLVDARWSLVDLFESDGKRFLVAKQNEPVTPTIETLTKRERQVATYAAAGHPSKLIAYELGIADSTVRVLLSRAMTRLQVKTRAALADALVRAAGAPTGEAET
jgi:DNA-binding CsgD family transcriptional regulator